MHYKYAFSALKKMCLIVINDVLRNKRGIIFICKQRLGKLNLHCDIILTAFYTEFWIIVSRQ